MRISTKGRYGLAVMIKLAENHGQVISIATLSNELGLSKIYLEQVLALLKAGELVTSLKGPQGGYILSRTNLNLSEILSVLEPGWFEATDASCADNTLNRVLSDSVYEPIQQNLDTLLKNLLLESLVSTLKERRQETPMFYI